MTVLVKSAEMAEILDVTPQRIGQLVKKGMPKFSRGQYDAAACVQWYIERLRAVGSDDPEKLKLERLKLYQSQRVKTDLENARTRREVIDADEVAIALNELAAIYASQLDAIGGRLANELSGMTDPGIILDKLTDEARAIRAAVANKIDALANTLDKRDDSKAAA